jgi:hypothetical protein
LQNEGEKMSKKQILLKAIKIGFYPVRLTYKAIIGFFKICIAIVTIGWIVGCASNSASFDKSPCAGCDFKKLPSVVVAINKQGVLQ